MAEIPIGHGFEEMRDGRNSYVGAYIDFTKRTSQKIYEWSPGRLAYGLNGRVYRYVNFMNMRRNRNPLGDLVALEDISDIDSWKVTNDTLVTRNALVGLIEIQGTNPGDISGQWGWVLASGIAENANKAGSLITWNKGAVLNMVTGTLTSSTTNHLSSVAIGLEAATSGNLNAGKVVLRGLI